MLCCLPAKTVLANYNMIKSDLESGKFKSTQIDNLLY